MNQRILSPGVDTTLEALTNALPAGLTAGTPETENERRVWVDTFDWRLAESGLSAFFVKTGRSRCATTARDKDGRETKATLPRPPADAASLADSPLADLLAPAIGIRRLLPVVSVTTSRTTVPVLDDLEKTVAWLAFEERSAQAAGTSRRHPILGRVLLTGVRGFDRETRAVAAALTGAKLLASESSTELDQALAAIGRSTGDYASKRRFDIDPAMPATEAVAQIFEGMLLTMRVNEAGVAARLDVEFLHDYRVAVRRTRSALSHFGGVLPPRTREWAAGFFKDLGNRTGAARDLDVLLLELPGYAHDLPARSRKALAAMTARFERDVDREYAAFSKWLASKTYASGLERWQKAIETLRAEDGGETIAALAKRAIDQTAAKVFKQARKIKKSEDDEAVHRLRLRCKKLRYVLEFSRSLTPGGEVTKLIAALKQLQDVLGTFNDLVVHNPRMIATAGREPVDTELLVATGWLLAELDRRYRKVRREVDGKVKLFRRDAPALLERVDARLAGDES